MIGNCAYCGAPLKDRADLNRHAQLHNHPARDQHADDDSFMTGLVTGLAVSEMLDQTPSIDLQMPDSSPSTDFGGGGGFDGAGSSGDF